jgi:hypothetical protein
VDNNAVPPVRLLRPLDDETRSLFWRTVQPTLVPAVHAAAVTLRNNRDIVRSARTHFLFFLLLLLFTRFMIRRWPAVHTAAVTLCNNRDIVRTLMYRLCLLYVHSCIVCVCCTYAHKSFVFGDTVRTLMYRFCLVFV